jgi:hypothetical protein
MSRWKTLLSLWNFVEDQHYFSHELAKQGDIIDKTVFLFQIRHA